MIKKISPSNLNLKEAGFSEEQFSSLRNQIAYMKVSEDELDLDKAESVEDRLGII